MATQLTDIWEIVDRSVFEKIRLLLVEHGLTPDVTLYPNTPAGVDAYRAELAVIKSTKGFAIELFGSGSSQKKYEKKTPRIVFIPRRIYAGDLGGNPEYIYTFNGTKFDAEVRPPQTSVYQFEISLVSDEIRQERAMNAIIGLALSKRAYVPFYTNVTTGDNEEFFAIQTTFRDVPDTEFGIMEKIYTYEARDLWDRENTFIPDAAAPLDEVTLTTVPSINEDDIDEGIVTIIP